MSACVKLGETAGSEVPGMLGQRTSGFMTFSAVMLLKCLISSAESVALVVEAGSMAAPIGKLTTPNFAAMTVLSAGAEAGLGSCEGPPPPLPGGGVNGSSPPHPVSIVAITAIIAVTTTPPTEHFIPDSS